MNSKITPNVENHVREAIRPSTLVVGKHTSVICFPGRDMEEDEGLIACLEKAGYFSVSTGSGSHAIATHVTADSFTLFDPVVGELTIPRDRLADWLAHDSVKKDYIEKLGGVSFTPYGVESVHQ
jgi:hypothetical protein